MNPPLYVYIRDDSRQRIRVIARHTLRAADLIEVVDRQAREGTWSYGILYDLRGVEAATPRDEAIAVAEHVERLVGKHGRRGPVALVTRVSRMIGAGYAYALDSTRGGRLVDVFWDFDEAERWLTSLARRPTP